MFELTADREKQLVEIAKAIICQGGKACLSIEWQVLLGWADNPFRAKEVPSRWGKHLKHIALTLPVQE